MKAVALLNLAGQGVDEHRTANLYWFRLFVLTHAAVRTGLAILPKMETFPKSYVSLGVVVILASMAGMFRPLTHTATRLVAFCVGVQVIMGMPTTANHLFLEFVVLAALSFLDEREENESKLLLQGLRWFTASFFFWSGLQKVFYGRYFDGQFLGTVVAYDQLDRFSAFLRFFMSAEEFERLRGLTPVPGAGPFSVDSPLFLVMSNSVYIIEIVAGLVLLFVPKLRVAAVVVSLAFMVAIEAGARELVFGVLMVNLLLLFVDSRWNKWMFPACAVFYAYLVAHTLRPDVFPFIVYAME